MTDVPANREPEYYVCPRTIVSPRLTGKLDDDVWGHAPWTADFVDIEGDRRPAPRFRTRARMLWDDHYFYVGALLEEPHLCGWITEHDATMFYDNDFEVFVDPASRGHHYGELEVNALNATWDLMLTRPYRSGGFPINEWEMTGLRTAVHLEGTLNDPSDIDTGWSIEIAMPWSVFGACGSTGGPPRDGEQWRVGFSRVEWLYDLVDGRYVKRPNTREDNWVWSPQDAIDMHRPERWGVVQFSLQTADLPSARPLEGWTDRLDLISVWESQRDFLQANGRYASSIAELGLDLPAVTIEATSGQFIAQSGKQWIDHNLHLLPETDMFTSHPVPAESSPVQ